MGTFAATFALLLVCGEHWTLGARHLGLDLGALSELHHGLRGHVYAVDARTLYVTDLHYDGEGPAAYFYVGAGKAPSAAGASRVRDERGRTEPLRRYRGDNVTLSLPEGNTLADVDWFYVWCDDFAVSFGEVKIPRSAEFPKPARLGALRGVHGVRSDALVVVDAQTLLVPNFSYDGEAPDAKFWVGRGKTPSPEGIRIPDENGKETPLRKYDNKTIVLTLPGELTVFDIGHFAVWCEAFTVNFGHVVVPQQKVANVPPSLKMLGVSPQTRSKSAHKSRHSPRTSTVAPMVTSTIPEIDLKTMILLKEELARRKEEEVRREEELSRRAEEEVRRQEEVVRREEELSRRAEEEVRREAELSLRAQEEVQREEELSRRAEEDVQREEELGRRKKDEIERQEELVRRDQVEVLRQEELVRRDQVEVLRQEEEVRRQKAEMHQKPVETRRQKHKRRNQALQGGETTPPAESASSSRAPPRHRHISKQDATTYRPNRLSADLLAALVDQSPDQSTDTSSAVHNGHIHRRADNYVPAQAQLVVDRDASFRQQSFQVQQPQYQKDNQDRQRNYLAQQQALEEDQLYRQGLYDQQRAFDRQRAHEQQQSDLFQLVPYYFDGKGSPARSGGGVTIQRSVDLDPVGGAGARERR